MTAQYVAPQAARINWMYLPLTLRQRWWRETDYGEKPPSAELLAALDEAVAALTTRKATP